MKLIILFLFVESWAADSNLDPHWDHFKLKHSKEYESDDHEAEHRAHFEDNVKKVVDHNLKYELGMEPYKQTVNKYSDKPHEQLLKELCGTKKPANVTRREMKIISRQSVPSSVDWRQNGRVTEVKNQGNCGSCWAFGATGAIEGQLATKGHSLQSLSEQQLVDCVYPRAGCSGGWPNTAFEKLKDGIQSESDYPYTEKKNGECAANKKRSVIKVDSYVDIPNDEESIKHALAKHGPLVGGIHATHKLMHYSSGVFKGACGKRTNHAILVVGYGEASGYPYWLVKNSWGDDWGEQGYVRMARNYRKCGTVADLSYPVLK